MDTRTGEIKEFGKDEVIPKHFVPITKKMKDELTQREVKERIYLYKKMKSQMIRVKKKDLGRRLTNEEMVALFQD